MNLLIVGDDVQDIAMEIWKTNTNYAVVNNSRCLWDKEFINYIKNKNVIVTTTKEQFECVNANEFLMYLEKYEFIPIFIAKDKDDFVCNMYTLIDDTVPEAVLFIRNENNEGYIELIKISTEYLFKRKKSNGDKTLRTPRKRKASASTK